MGWLLINIFFNLLILINIFSGVAGASISGIFSYLDIDAIASLIAKKTLIANIRGGSPVVLDLLTTFSTLDPFLKISTLKIFGISLIAGILYVEGENVFNLPELSQTTSSIVNHP